MNPIVDAREVERFRDLIRARTGMAFPPSRNAHLARAIRRATAEAGLPDASALYDPLTRSAGVGPVFDTLVSALDVSETHFFRDAGQIQELRDSILPELVARRRRDRRLRIWSAGCSTGEEPYTLAILLRQLVPDLTGWDVRVLATDINGSSIERARRGTYREWSFRAMPASMLRGFVLPKEDRFEVAPTIRQMVTFARLNLAEPVYPSVSTDTFGMDLILCRNVLLYFDQAQARVVVDRLWSSLDDNGRLLVSRVDASLPIFGGVRPDRPGAGVFSKGRTPSIENGERTRRPQDRSSPAINPPRRNVRAPVEEDETREHTPAQVKRAPQRRPETDRVVRPELESAGPRADYEQVLREWQEAGIKDACELLSRSVRRHPLDAPLRYLQGLILLQDGDPAGALAAFRRSTYIDPEFALGHLGLGTVFARAGHVDRSRTALETAARLVADLEPDELVFAEEELTAAEVLELIAAERALLGRTASSEGADA